VSDAHGVCARLFGAEPKPRPHGKPHEQGDAGPDPDAREVHTGAVRWGIARRGQLGDLL
jgi:hypothetical protein